MNCPYCGMNIRDDSFECAYCKKSLIYIDDVDNEKASIFSLYKPFIVISCIVIICIYIIASAFSNPNSVFYKAFSHTSVSPTNLFFNKKIDRIKNSTLKNEQTITIGQAIDSYDYFSKRNWKYFKKNNGQEIVEFDGDYDILRHSPEYSNMILNPVTHEWGEGYDNVICSNISKIFIIMQFALNKKNDGFRIEYYGLDVETKEGLRKRIDIFMHNRLLSAANQEATLFGIMSLFGRNPLDHIYDNKQLNFGLDSSKCLNQGFYVNESDSQ